MARGFRRFSTDALKILDELVAMESEPSKVSKLQMLKMAWTADSENKLHLNRALESSKKEGRKEDLEACKVDVAGRKVDLEGLKASQRALESLKANLEEQKKAAYEGTLEAYKGAVEAYKGALEATRASKAYLLLKLLRTQRLDNTRGLFLYLQDEIMDLHPLTPGRRGSEATWALVLAANTTLTQCLRENLGSSANLSTHLVTTYETLSQHIHARNDLLVYPGGAIVFERYYLSPQQCEILVCLGKAVGVSCVPAPKRYIEVATGSCN